MDYSGCCVRLGIARDTTTNLCSQTTDTTDSRPQTINITNFYI